jgi:hypothetical protein
MLGLFLVLTPMVLERAPSTMHILFDLRELVCIARLGP